MLVQNPPANAEDLRGMDLTPGSRRSLEGGHGNPLQYSCLENLMDQAVWRTPVHKVVESDMTEATLHASTVYFIYIFKMFTGLIESVNVLSVVNRPKNKSIVPVLIVYAHLRGITWK